MSEKDRGTFEGIGETVGGMAGRMAGRATDMGMDVVGSIFGSATEALGDWWASASARDAGRSFDEAQDRAARQHFERTAGERASGYDSARPLYQFGHVAAHNPEYQGRNFREVEPELERAWGEAQQTRYGAWPDVREYVGRGFDTRAEVVRETREASMRAQGGGEASENEIRVDANRPDRSV